MVIENNSMISTERVLQALLHYREKGYQMIDVPLCVSLDDMYCTLDSEKEVDQFIHINDMYYVGSAEQSFVHMYNKGLLPDGKYMALTPCIRDEEQDETHFSCFLKLELIHVGTSDYMSVLQDARDLYLTFSTPESINIVSSGNRPEETDITINDIEVGSYGKWEFSDGKKFVYGTGLAEPRMGIALRK